MTAVAKRATVCSPLAIEKLPEYPILQLPMASFPPEYESQKSDTCHSRTSASEGIGLLAIGSVRRLGSDQDGSQCITREPLPSRRKDPSHRPLASTPAVLMRRRISR